MIDWINCEKYWQPALDQDGNERDDAWVINATQVMTFNGMIRSSPLPLGNYPPGTKIFLRAEPLHPGAKPTLLDLDGLTNARAGT